MRYNDEVINEHADIIKWSSVAQSPDLKYVSIDCLKKYECEFSNEDWEFISQNQCLSEDFIREFKDKVDWTLICENQTLSEDFINEFEDKVDWSLISIYQRPFNKKFSIEFLKKNINKIDWGCYSVFHTLTTEEKKEFKKELKKIK